MAEVILEMFLPLSFDLQWHLGKSVTWEVHQTLGVSQSKKIHQLGAARCFAGASQFALAGNGINTGGLTGVGATGKGNLCPYIGGALAQFGGASEKVGGLEIHDEGSCSILCLRVASI